MVDLLAWNIETVEVKEGPEVGTGYMYLRSKSSRRNWSPKFVAAEVGSLAGDNRTCGLVKGLAVGNKPTGSRINTERPCLSLGWPFRGERELVLVELRRDLTSTKKRVSDCNIKSVQPSRQETLSPSFLLPVSSIQYNIYESKLGMSWLRVYTLRRCIRGGIFTYSSSSATLTLL